MFINGVSQTKTGTNNNYGYSNSITGSVFRIGKSGQSQSLRGVKIDELAIWGSDQSVNVADIYNSGTPFNLDTLTNKPNHWWRMGDEDTYPYLQDNGTSANCIFQMYNMTAADIVTDTP